MAGKTLEINWEATAKQEEAFDLLQDNTPQPIGEEAVMEILYGGGAGGGKSYLGCVWLAQNCLHYPESRWLMGRAHLKDLKESTLLTFFEVMRHWKLESGKEWKYHPMDGVIRWFNGSAIYLKDLFAYPSDPEFQGFGSTEFDGAFFDECGEVTVKAKNIVASRLRHKTHEFGLVPKLLMCSNPTKNFLYYDFFKPWEHDTNPAKAAEPRQLLPNRKFVQSLVKDNRFIDPAYAARLRHLDEISRERLLYGNWEYDDDPSALIEYNKIIDLWTNPKATTGKKYITCDPARYGGDLITIGLWDGLDLQKLVVKRRQSTTLTAQDIDKLAPEGPVSRSNMLADDDGVGGGVVDQLPGCQRFVNNSSPISTIGGKQQYSNLKTQCHYMLAEKVNAGLMSISAPMPVEYKQMIIEDLEQIKRKNMDKDGKLEIVGKDEVKEKIGRSPDFGDMLAMRMKFELNTGTWRVANRGL